MYVRAGRPAFARPYVGAHWSKSLMSSYPASAAVSCMSGSSNLDSFCGGRQVGRIVGVLWGCCRQDLFNIARSILV